MRGLCEVVGWGFAIAFDIEREVAEHLELRGVAGEHAAFEVARLFGENHWFAIVGIWQESAALHGRLVRQDTRLRMIRRELENIRRAGYPRTRRMDCKRRRVVV